MVRNVLTRAGKGIGRGATALASIKPDRRSKYLQDTNGILDRIIRNNKGIMQRYEGIKRILQNVQNRIRDSHIFSEAGLVVFSNKPHKEERGWDLSRHPEIQRLVEWVEKELRLILEEIKRINRGEIEISKEEAELGIEEWVKGRGIVDVEFIEVREILKKHENIKNRIEKYFKKKKRLINDVKRAYKGIEKIKDIAEVHKEKNKKGIRRIQSPIEGLIKIDGELSEFFEDEFRFEEREYQIMRVLVQGLKSDKGRFKEIEKLYGGFNISANLLSRYTHFGTSLDIDEEKIIVYEIAPVIIKLHYLFGEFKKLIIGEKGLVNEFLGIVEDIKGVQTPDSTKKLKPGLILRFRDVGKELIRLIESKELPKADEIFGLEDKISDSFKKLDEVENKRKSLEEKLAEEVEKSEADLAEKGGIYRRAKGRLSEEKEIWSRRFKRSR